MFKERCGSDLSEKGPMETALVSQLVGVFCLARLRVFAAPPSPIASCSPVLLFSCDAPSSRVLSPPSTSASAIFFPLALALLTLASLPSLTKWGDDATQTLAVGRPVAPHVEPWRQSRAANGPKHPDGEGSAKP